MRLSTVKKWLGRVEPGTTGRAHVEAIYEASTPTQAAGYCKDPAKRHPDYSGFLFEKGKHTSLLQFFGPWVKLIIRRFARGACLPPEFNTK